SRIHFHGAISANIRTEFQATPVGAIHIDHGLAGIGTAVLNVAGCISQEVNFTTVAHTHVALTIDLEIYLRVAAKCLRTLATTGATKRRLVAVLGTLLGAGGFSVHIVADVTNFEVSIAADSYFRGLSECNASEKAGGTDKSCCTEKNFFHTICSL